MKITNNNLFYIFFYVQRDIKHKLHKLVPHASKSTLPFNIKFIHASTLAGSLVIPRMTASITTKRKLEQCTPSISNFFKPNEKIQKVNLSSKSSLPPFDKKAWIDSLSPAERDLLQLEIDTLDNTWLAVIHSELTKPYFLSLKRFLKEELDKKKTIFPKQHDIYSWSNLTPLDNVKVIILGQDPYHNFNQAHGLAFSVNPPTVPPASLKNIFKGLQDCYPDFKPPKSGSLISWAKQGVLLLNACLTVEAHKANSHSNRGWENFTEKVLEAAIKSRPSGLCFLVWGTPAAKRVDKISPGRNHLILKSVHPSPLSASRGFFTNKHFVKANEWLFERYGAEGVINWALDPNNIIKEIQQMKGRTTEPVKSDAKDLQKMKEVAHMEVVKKDSKDLQNKISDDVSNKSQETRSVNVEQKTSNLSTKVLGDKGNSLEDTLDEMLEEHIDDEIEVILSQEKK